ncbi:hypothetical protein G6F32_014585 [Rhizopus arrhizus]|nr:hypothetical protein G6F32_014585 [Rhizopus arrhizus]
MRIEPRAQCIALQRAAFGFRAQAGQLRATYPAQAVQARPERGPQRQHHRRGVPVEQQRLGAEVGHLATGIHPSQCQRRVQGDDHQRLRQRRAERHRHGQPQQQPGGTARPPAGAQGQRTHAPAAAEQADRQADRDQHARASGVGQIGMPQPEAGDRVECPHQRIEQPEAYRRRGVRHVHSEAC